LGEGRRRGRGEGQRPVRELDPRPFSETLAGYIAAHAEQRLDISHPTIAIDAPELVEVILAREFGAYGVIQGSWHKAQIALLLIAEERVGAPMRQDARERKAEEDAGFDALKAAIGAR
jgi:hypothetical protein